MAEPNTSGFTKTDAPKPKAKRVVKKRPIVVMFTGENIVIKGVTRDLEEVVAAMQADPSTKIYKVSV
jgi:hypothetical protein